PLPTRVIARLMGIDGDDDVRFITWSDDLAAFIGAPTPTLQQARRAQHSLLDMSRYFQSRLTRGAFSADDLVGRLAHAANDGSIEDGAELLAQCAMLLFAGHETTRNLLGNGLYHLLSRPGLWSALRRKPGRLTGAVRELLRFDSPVQYTGRRVATDLVLHGQPLRRGGAGPRAHWRGQSRPAPIRGSRPARDRSPRVLATLFRQRPARLHRRRADVDGSRGRLPRAYATLARAGPLETSGSLESQPGLSGGGGAPGLRARARPVARRSVLQQVNRRLPQRWDVGDRAPGTAHRAIQCSLPHSTRGAPNSNPTAARANK